ncbi:MAG: RagB/SusD family nutrient uptake outer membrane protein [Bacteroidota bacterium]
MKKLNFKIIYIIVILNILFSCSEDFIDLNPISNPSIKSFYQKQSDFEVAIVGTYNAWGDIHSLLWTWYTELRGDTYTAYQGDQYEISENKFSENVTAEMWDAQYRIITYSNVILDRIDNIEPFDETVKSRIKAEARFFRAEAYFALVRFFGAVPLIEHEITSLDDLKIGRTDVTTIYNFIIDDYKFAVNNLPTEVSASDYGRLSKYSAEGELARVYITLSGKVYNQNRWADAKPLLEDILYNSPYTFTESYEEIFARDGSGEKGEEIILSAIFKAEEGENTMYQTQMMGKYGTLSLYLEEGVMNSYEDGDIRKDINVAPDFTRITDGIYVDMPTNVKFDYLYDIGSGFSGMDFPILRYTDVMLLYAETLAEIDNNVPTQSIEILNQVRNRAGLVSLTMENVPNINAFRMFMENERRSELMFECVRWFDLVRTGRAIEVLRALGKDADETWLLFPIPEQEIAKVGSDILPQNPGY